MPRFATLVLAVITLPLALGASARAADATGDDAVLPSESAGGEWLQDKLDDPSLWFAGTDNLVFESVATAVAGRQTGRRWVGVIGGQPAWIVYYVPGELLGFEADTWHHAGAATDFHFLAGADVNDLSAVDDMATEPVEIRDAWLRVLHLGATLPPNASFLMIQFPADVDRDGGRLAEVWLHYREASQTLREEVQPPAIESAPPPIAPEFPQQQPQQRQPPPVQLPEPPAPVPPPIAEPAVVPIAEEPLAEIAPTEVALGAEPPPSTTGSHNDTLPPVLGEPEAVAAPEISRAQPAPPPLVEEVSHHAPDRLLRRRGPRSK
jgi:hypothetical protein